MYFFRCSLYTSKTFFFKYKNLIILTDGYFCPNNGELKVTLRVKKFLDNDEGYEILVDRGWPPFPVKKENG